MEPKVPKYQGRDVLRGYVVKDDAGSYAAFSGKVIVRISVKGRESSG